jgi:vancomycin resistance protein VanJ
MKRRRPSPLLGWLAGAYVAVLAVALAAIYALGDRTWPSAMATYFPAIFWSLPALVIVPWCLHQRRWALAAASVVGSAWFAFGLSGFRGSAPPPGDGELKVVTFNIRHAQRGWQEIERLAAEHRPDVLLFQETNALKWAGPNALRLEGYVLKRRGEFAVASRRPFSWLPMPQADAGRVGAVAVEVDGVTFVSVHLSSFSGRRRVLTDTETGLRGLVHVTRNHQDEVRALMEDLHGVERVVIGGDFNMPPRGGAYDALRRTYRDAFAEVGQGFGFTYYAGAPFERIDYLFSRGLTPTSCRVLPAAGSDHLPVLAEFARSSSSTSP